MLELIKNHGPNLTVGDAVVVGLTSAYTMYNHLTTSPNTCPMKKTSLVALGTTAALYIKRLWLARRFLRSMKVLTTGNAETAVARRNGYLAHAEFKLLPYQESWPIVFEKERLAIHKALVEAGMGKYLVALNKKEAKLLPQGHPNDGSIIPLGSTAIKGVELATPFADSALMVTVSPWELPAEFGETLRKMGYLCNGCAPHNPNGEDQWWLRCVPGPKAAEQIHEDWSEERKARHLEHHDGFDIHVVGPEAHDFVVKSLSFGRYLEINDEARGRYMAYKKGHAEGANDATATPDQNGARLGKYKGGKNAVCREMQVEAVQYAKQHIMK